MKKINLIRLDSVIVVCILLFGYAPLESADQWINYTSGSDVRAMALEGDKYIWCGSSGGAARFDIGSEDKVIFTRADGLSSNNVYSIAIDSKGNKWFGTDSGVSVLSSDTTWTYFNEDHSPL